MTKPNEPENEQIEQPENPIEDVKKWLDSARLRDGTPLSDADTMHLLFSMGHTAGAQGMDALYALLHITACAVGRLAGFSPERIHEIHTDRERENVVAYEVFIKMLEGMGAVMANSPEELEAILDAMHNQPPKDELN